MSDYKNKRDGARREGFTPFDRGRRYERNAHPTFDRPQSRNARFGKSYGKVHQRDQRRDDYASSSYEGRHFNRYERSAGNVENRYEQGRVFGSYRNKKNHDNGNYRNDGNDQQSLYLNEASSVRGRSSQSFERGFDRPRTAANSRFYDGKKRSDYRKANAGKQRIDYKEEAYDPNKPIRLNKFLANAGICSRRDADKYIEAGVVMVNGEIVTELGRKVLRTDMVLFHEQPIKAEKKIYVLLNKPKGYVTTSEDPQNRKTVMDLVRNACMERIYPVGRLDRNTTGVLLLTNDGELASKLTHPKFLKKKIYHVYLDRNVSVTDLRKIAEGITLEDGDIKADAVDYASETDKKQVGIEIHSGKNRIVRRIFASLGYNVIKLDRVYFAGLTKKNVKRGDWRYLTEDEVNMLRMGAYE